MAPTDEKMQTPAEVLASAFFRNAYRTLPRIFRHSFIDTKDYPELVEAMADAIRELAMRDTHQDVKRAGRRYAVLPADAWQAMLFAASNVRRQP